MQATLNQPRELGLGREGGDVVAPHGDDDGSRLARVAGQLPQPGERLLRVTQGEGLLELVDDEHRVARPRLPRRSHRGGPVPTRREDRHRPARPAQPGHQPGAHQRGLAGSGGAADHEDRCLVEPGQARHDVGVAAEEGVAVTLEVGLEALPRTGLPSDADLVVGGQAGVLGQDPRLEGDQLGAGVQAELLTERPTRGTDRGQGVGLTSAAVLRQSQQRPAPLAERLLPGQHGPVRGHAEVVAGVQPCLQQVLLGRQPQLTETHGLQAARQPLLETVERRAPPQGERLPQQRDRPLRRPVRQVLLGTGHQVLELLPVQVEPVGRQPVPAGHGLDGVDAQRLPEPAHAPLDDLRPGGRRVLSPQRLGQDLGVHPLPRAQRERRDDDPVTGPERLAAVVDLERTEHAEAAHLVIVSRWRNPVNGADTGLIPPRRGSDTGGAQSR